MFVSVPSSLHVKVLVEVDDGPLVTDQKYTVWFSCLTSV